MEPTSMPISTPALPINNDEARFVATSEIHNRMQRFYERGIHPIIVLIPPQHSLSLNGLPLCGSVFLKWDGSRLPDQELESFGIQLNETLKASIDANWCHFEALENNAAASYVESVPNYTTREIGVDCFEFSSPTTKWTVLGSRDMVGDEPNFARKCFNSLLHFLSRVEEIDSNLLKLVGIPVAIDISKKLDLTNPDVALIYCVVAFFLFCADLSKGSALARRLNSAAFIYAVAHFLCGVLYSLPLQHLLCVLGLVCVMLTIRCRYF